MYPHYGGHYAAAPAYAGLAPQGVYHGYPGVSPGFAAAAPQVAYGGGRTVVGGVSPVAYGGGRAVVNAASPFGFPAAAPQVAAYGGGRAVVHAAPQAAPAVRLAATPRVAQPVYEGGAPYAARPAAAPAQVRYVQQARPSVFQQPVQQQYVQAAPATKPYSDVNDKIVELLRGGVLQFREASRPFFDQAAAQSGGYLNYETAVHFMEDASQALVGYKLSTGELPEIEYGRFDFNGDGTLDFKEASMCLRKNLIQLQEDLGFKPQTNVAFKTPEQAGYTVVKELASGGQGTTALARDNRGCDVALKIYDKANANAGGIEDLVGEMEVMKELEICPQVMSCIEIFQDQRHFYCANELMPGGDLAALRRKTAEAGVPLTEAYFQCIFTQCIVALEFMHKNALMHCDIKEPNVMIKNTDLFNPQCALIDFGLTKASAGDGESGGTPGYMPPEFFQTNSWVPRGDIFSMGVVFFQLLADKTPNSDGTKMGLFTENLPPGWQANMMQAIAQTTTSREPDWHLIEGQYPGTMDILPAMLNKDYRNRPKAPQLLAQPFFLAQPVPLTSITK